MSVIAELLDRLSGVAVLKERIVDVNRNVERSLAWLLEHEKRLIHLEAQRAAPPAPESARRLPRR